MAKVSSRKLFNEIIFIFFVEIVLKQPDFKDL